MATEASGFHLPISVQMRKLYPAKENTMASLKDLNRDELNLIAEQHDINAEDYSRKDDLVTALKEAGVESDSVDTSSNAPVDTQDAPEATEGANATPDTFASGQRVYVAGGGMGTIIDPTDGGEYRVRLDDGFTDSLKESDLSTEEK